MIILDEIHKARLWKRTLKGIYDASPAPANWIVTGSARLDVFRRGSDSLLGRFLPFRLHPFTLSESLSLPAPEPGQFEGFFADPHPAPTGAEQALQTLLAFGPFPEPWASQNQRFTNVWRRSRNEMLIRQDLRDLTRLPELGDVELLASLLPERVGSLLSRSSLRENLSVSHPTIDRWLKYLEAIYLFFEIKPFSRNVARSLRKEGKAYLWDYSALADPGARFENLIASHLLKACELWEDSGHGQFQLRYLRDKDRHEIDFLVLRDQLPWLAVEAKLTDLTPAPGWNRFLPFLATRNQFPHAVQVVQSPNVFRRVPLPKTTLHVMSASTFLAALP